MGKITEDKWSFTSPGGLEFGVVDPVVVASVAGLQPASKALLTTISGTNQLTLITLPWPGFSGFICYRPTGAFTGATGGAATDLNKPIGLAFTAVVGKILYMFFDPTTNLWYPSYTA